ncbi:MAG: putative oxidoreductase [Ilumatobacteraceae bacterium]|nr:putative oxidoreductase [Ilumatobacteraceae bacterium]
MTIGVIGTGSVGRRHIQNLRTLGQDVVAVSARRGVDAFDLDGEPVRCVPDIAAAVDLGVDAVVVANETSLHRDTTHAAIALGLDVYLEKPATITAPECAALAAEAATAGVTVAVGHQLRAHPLIGALHALVQGGTLGRILSVDANWGEHLADYHPDEDYRTGYAARRELGGGVLLTQIHLPDLLHLLFGPFDAVFASGGHRSDLELDVDDTVTFLAHSHDGVAVHAHLDYLQRPKRATIAVTGTEGRAEIDVHAATLTVRSSEPGSEPVVTEHAVERNDLFVATMADFLAARAGEHPPAVDLDEATRVLGLTDAIRASMESGRLGDPTVRA